MTFIQLSPMRIYVRKYISFAFLNIAGQSTIRQGRREVPQASLMCSPGAAFLPLSSRLNRKRTFPRLYHFEANHEQTLSERTTRMTGFLSEWAEGSRASDLEASDTEWHSTSGAVSHLHPAAEAEEDQAEYLPRCYKRSRCCGTRREPVITDSQHHTRTYTHC